MTKASLKLDNGTIVHIEGSVDEVKELLDFYNTKPAGPPRSRKIRQETNTANDQPHSQIDLAQIANAAKECDEWEGIETQILDKSSQIDRTLLPLYIVQQHLENTVALTSGQISKVITMLGVPISQANVSHVLAGGAARYVIGDKVKKKGQAVKYRLSRRGMQHMKHLICGTPET